jgi:hypothetical protein
MLSNFVENEEDFFEDLTKTNWVGDSHQISIVPGSFILGDLATGRAKGKPGTLAKALRTNFRILKMLSFCRFPI